MSVHVVPVSPERKPGVTPLGVTVGGVRGHIDPDKDG